MLLHENVLQKNCLCGADLSGNLTLSKCLRSWRTWKKNVLQPLGQSACWILGNSETCVLLVCCPLQAGKPETESGPSSLNIRKLFLEDLVDPVSVADTSLWILSACKPGAHWKHFQSLKPTAAHPPPRGMWVVAISGNQKCSFSVCLCALEAGVILRGWFVVDFLTN